MARLDHKKNLPARMSRACSWTSHHWCTDPRCLCSCHRRWQWQLICDTCGERAADWGAANQHEEGNLDHWVQLVQVEQYDVALPEGADGKESSVSGVEW